MTHNRQELLGIAQKLREDARRMNNTIGQLRNLSKDMRALAARIELIMQRSDGDSEDEIVTL
jgi:hypothetical protein